MFLFKANYHFATRKGKTQRFGDSYCDLVSEFTFSAFFAVDWRPSLSESRSFPKAKNWETFKNRLKRPLNTKNTYKYNMWK